MSLIQQLSKDMGLKSEAEIGQLTLGTRTMKELFIAQRSTKFSAKS